jgi:GNAT superfamily N-acetyltransferase
MRVLHSAHASEIAGWASAATLLPFDAADFTAHRADLHICALSQEGIAQARCSLWWADVSSYRQHRVGVVGHYAATDDEAAAAALTAALERLRQVGCTIAIGPMNGTTWRNYRFVTERGEQPPFFLEPTNPEEAPRQFERAGFSLLATYFSTLNDDVSRPDPRREQMEKKIADAGITIRSANSDLGPELTKIYEVSKVAFRQNFLYTEIPQAEFVAMYRPLLPIVRPELVLLAEKAGRCVGYLFAIPDLAMKMRGPEIDTFIIKTVAVLPEPQVRGLGSLLVARAQQIGRELGFRRCIHALMFEDNISLNISRHYASVMRKYTLYSKDLTQ